MEKEELNQLQNILFKEIRKRERAILLKEGKIDIACLLNELEERVKITEPLRKSFNYLRAIKDMKKWLGIEGTIYELFRFQKITLYERKNNRSVGDSK